MHLQKTFMSKEPAGKDSGILVYFGDVVHWVV